MTSVCTMKNPLAVNRFLFFSLFIRPITAFGSGKIGPRTFASPALVSSSENILPTFKPTTQTKPISRGRRLFSTSAGSPPQISHIGKEQMEEILEDYEEGGREESMYIVIDVRTDEEVLATGKLSPSVYTLPVQIIMQRNVFQLEPEDFEEVCGFAKPTPDETIVFSCAAGVRSVYACQFASQAGYSKLVNYAGGSNEWFMDSF